MIDTGGHSLIRAAVKNYLNTTIIVDLGHPKQKFSNDKFIQKNTIKG